MEREIGISLLVYSNAYKLELLWTSYVHAERDAVVANGNHFSIKIGEIGLFTFICRFGIRKRIASWILSSQMWLYQERDNGLQYHTSDYKR